MKIAKMNSLWVIEDCAQAHLAKWDDINVGTYGDLSTFSFYPGKNLGAIGDAGAIVTNSKNLADFAARFARHGGLVKHEHIVEGVNSRMDGLQASILNLKLPYLNNWTKRRKKLAEMYSNALSHIREIELPVEYEKGSHVWHQYVIKIDNRDHLKGYLKSKGIETMITYPESLPFLKAYEYKDHRHSDFPVAYEHKSKILSRPLYPELTNDQVNYVINSVVSYYEHS
jgi:dTDP-4-amino-4,6-dideoxygalactose transaminase